jgi:hypothetical protein
MSLLLFYSNYCKHSAKFIKFLEQSGQSEFCAKICVDKDESNRRHNFVTRYNITEVPSMIVENQVLPGKSAFDWLSSKSEGTPSIDTRMNKVKGNIKDLNTCKNIDVVGADDDIFKCSFVYLSNPQVSINTPEEGSDITNIRGKVNITDDNLMTETSTKKFTISKKDSLKSKQFENKYNKMMEERSELNPEVRRL